MIRKRFAQLTKSLGSKEYLEDQFTAADLIMTTVSARCPGTGR